MFSSPSKLSRDDIRLPARSRVVNAKFFFQALYGLNAVMGDVELVQIMERVESLQVNDPVALDAQSRQFFEFIKVFQLPYLVFAQKQLLQVDQAFQILNLSDPVVSQLEHFQMYKMRQVLDLGDLVGHEEEPPELCQALQALDGADPVVRDIQYF